MFVIMLVLMQLLADWLVRFMDCSIHENLYMCVRNACLWLPLQQLPWGAAAWQDGQTIAVETCTPREADECMCCGMHEHMHNTCTNPCFPSHAILLPPGQVEQ